MKSSAYVLGVLDVLVKSGEVSPAYAAGVADVLSKQADWNPFWWDSAGQNYQEEMQKWLANNPNARDPVTGRINITGDQAAQIIDNSRHWWTGAGRRSMDYLGNRIRKAFRWWPGTTMTADMYDRELEDRRNAFRNDYMKDLRSQTGVHAEVEGALQDKHVQDADFRVLDAQRTMLPSEREAAGYTPDYADRYRNIYGTGAIQSGIYKPKYDKVRKTPYESKYGKGLPKSFGNNAGMFYTTNWANPLNQQ